MGITSDNTDSKQELATLRPTDDALPVGDNSFQLPAGITGLHNDSKQTISAGTGAAGSVAADGETTTATISVIWAGRTIESTTTSERLFTVTGVPEGAVAGESMGLDGARQVQVQTERGGYNSHDLTEKRITSRAFFSFDILRAEVMDADGDMVAGKPVTLDSEITFVTDDEGRVVMETSGEVELASLGGSLSKVGNAGQEDAVTFQYAGVEGTVATPDGDTITGKPVALINENEQVVAVSETDETGAYSFNQVPVDTLLYVAADPYFRFTTSRGEGEYLLKSFPSETMRKGDPFGDSSEVGELQSIRVTGVDALEGDPAAGVETLVGDFDVETDAQGVAKGIVDNAESIEVSIGGGRRYRNRQFEVDPENLTTEDADVGEVELERKVRSSQT